MNAICVGEHTLAAFAAKSEECENLKRTLEVGEVISKAAILDRQVAMDECERLKQKLRVAQVENEVLRDHREQALQNLGVPNAASLPDECLAVAEYRKRLAGEVDAANRHVKILTEAREADFKTVHRLTGELELERETWTDEHGTCWRRPTANAYANTCKALHERKLDIVLLQADYRRVEGLLGHTYDTIRAVAVDGLGLSDPSADNAPAQPPPEWDGLLSKKVAQLRTENKSLVAALQACVRWMRDDDHVLKQFEDIGEWFYKETGYLRPGKDSASFENTYERETAWNKWCESKAKSIRSEGQRVLDSLAAAKS